MTDTDRILQKLEEQGKQLAQLQIDVSGLKSDVGITKSEKIPGMQQQLSNLELNIEAFRAEQGKVNDELMGHIMTSNDINGEEQQRQEKRIDRIEKHLNLPPVK